ncbi:hypothetical protein DL96DRAFT_1456583 [Flagelloscypha sp. PMI_526]|nr:hypothetical protein DL96DRAFT_1456583 [Flagelloscypha sp. PMI_526]
MNEESIAGGLPPVPPKDFLGVPGLPRRVSSVPASRLANLSAVERSSRLRTARMNPHLQFMCGPLLRYDTVDSDGIWHGAALVVTADSGSIYEPLPTLTYSWDPDASVNQLKPNKSSGHKNSGNSFDLGPHPADPLATSVAMPSASMLESADSVSMSSQSVVGEEIWVYGGYGGTFTFWRFMIHIPLSEQECMIHYSINAGQTLRFFIPGRGQEFRWAAHSCNGFSAGVNPDDFRGPGFRSGYDPLWTDLLEKHNAQPFHALVGGGDQLYCDRILREPELQEWNNLSPNERKTHGLTDEISEAIDRFLFNHYCSSFRSGAFARANSTIPMMNMCDDHDLIDGFGSYPEDMQIAPVFRAIGSRGYFFFLLFQCFINPEVDGVDDMKHSTPSLIIGGDGPYVPFPSHSFLAYLGPKTRILLLDCRAERKKDQVCSPFQYEKVFKRLKAIPSGVEHLVIQVGVPIFYPRMVFLESALESKLNPITALAKNGSMGLSGFVNKFNADAELLDDLNDHWCAKSHKTERNWLVQQTQEIAKHQKLRISWLSGDVHCAAVGVVKSLIGKKEHPLPPEQDHRWMVNVVTSAIVNTPPPNAVISLVSSLATKTHRTLHKVDTDEAMLPVFDKETNGNPRKQKYIMGARNWCGVRHENGSMVYTIQVEKDKGVGTTVPYSVSVPPPGW